jgi:hypothetical protein
MDTSTDMPQVSTPVFSIYYGTIVYCVEQTKLFIKHGSLWVGRDGKIEGFATVPPNALIEARGWSIKDTAAIESGENGFFFLGFVGMCKTELMHQHKFQSCID